MELIITDAIGNEKGYLQCASVDIENGDRNDFEIVLNRKNYNKEIYSPGCRIFAPGTEWGGVINTIHPSGELLYLNGPTWRGRLDKSVVEPDEGEDYLILTGDVHTVMQQVLKRQGLTELFRVPQTSAGVTVTNYSFPRYYSVLEGFLSMLRSLGMKLVIKYIRGSANDIGYVQLQASKIRDYSDQVEIGNDMQIRYDIKVDHGIPNHLICLGSGELKDRLVIHLYRNRYGQIVEQPYYTDVEKIDAVYESSAESDADKLRSDGIKRFKELIQSVTAKAYITVTDRINVDIGDIVSGRERITGIKVRVPVVRKVYTRNGREEIFDYKLKGE